MSEKLLEHLNDLKKRALGEREEYSNKFKKYEQYYSGEFKKGSENSEYNIVKGIIDTKVSFILDNNIVSSVVPRTKSFADISQIKVQNSIADIMMDCNKNILQNNKWDGLKADLVMNANKYGCGILETVWSQGEEDNLGDVEINSINPPDFYPDLAAKKVKDMNYCFIKEVYSSITLKKKYPKYAEKIKPNENTQDNVTDWSQKKPTGTSVTNTDGFINQIYTYGDDTRNSIQESTNVTVWKCYLKDDSTFIDEKDKEKEQLRYKYPNGRLIIFVDGAVDYVLEDRAIDYPFGFPLDVLSTNNSILGDSPIKYLMEIQDRINKSFKKVRYLIGAYMSAIVISDDSGLNKNDIINQAVISIEELDQTPTNITNNTLGELKTVIEYISFLKDAAYEIARVNPQMISGERQAGVTSGDMVTELNESPMTSIREAQKLLKECIISQGNKNIALIQLFYNLPRIVRISEGKEYAKIPMRQEGQEAQPIEIFDEEGQIIADREIKGDLSIGKYEIEVIAGSEMPRSRAEKAKITMQLANMGVIDPQSTQGANILLTALDYPEKRAVMELKEEEEQAMNESAPPINLPIELAEKIFKDLPLQHQEQYLSQFGFEPLTAEQGAIEQMKGIK